MTEKEKLILNLRATAANAGVTLSDDEIAMLFDLAKKISAAGFPCTPLTLVRTMLTFNNKIAERVF
jgi:hypothetical protein